MKMFARVAARPRRQNAGASYFHTNTIEVKTGLLGLGKHFYVPFNAIQDVTSGCVFVNLPKEQVEEQGWDVKPDYLDEMS